MKKNISLSYQVILGVILGVAIGILSLQFHWIFIVRLFQTFNLMFTDLLQWLIPLFIISYMVPTIAKISHSGSNLLFKVFIHTVIFCYLGVFLSFIIGKALFPILLHTVPGDVLQSVDVKSFFRLPLTPLLSTSQALSLAILLILFGHFTSSSPLILLLVNIQEWIKTILQRCILPLIPFYILSVFVRISSQGPSTTILLILLPIILVTIFSCLGIFLLYHIILFLFRVRMTPWKFLHTYRAPLGFAMASQSSSATLPVTLETCYKNGLDPQVTEFVIPLATSINAVGGSICVMTSAISVAFINGLSLSWKSFLSFMINVPPTIFTSAGIPGGSSFIVAPLLAHTLKFNTSSVGFTQALILIQDPIATATNVMSCIIIALLLDKQKATENLVSGNPL